MAKFANSNTIIFAVLIICTLACFAQALPDQNGQGWQEPTTKAPTTKAPTTKAPTTKAPTTAPTTKAPTTKAPTTKAPTTEAPTTQPSFPEHPGHGHGGSRPHFPSSPSVVYNTPYEEANINVTQTLYANLVYPIAQQILATETYPAGLFSNTTGGRIVPLGEFTDPLGSFEYFYGLAGASHVVSLAFVHMMAKGNMVAFRVDILFDGNATHTGQTGLYNLTQEGWITFDEESRILSYDLVILRLGQSNLPVPTSAYPAYYAEICQVHEAYCTGANQQYADYSSCLADLATQPYGTWDNAGSNTTVCRILHSILVPLRPEFHCPHIGPTGGGFCVDSPYDLFYQEQF